MLAGPEPVIELEELRRIGARSHPLYYMNLHDIDALLSFRNELSPRSKAMELLRIPPDTRHWPVINDGMTGAVARQMDRFAKAISGEEPMLATVEDGYRAQRIATAVHESIETGTAVAPSDVV